MVRSSLAPAVYLLLSPVLASGCGDDDTNAPPDGVSCSSTKTIGGETGGHVDGAPGSCVVVTSNLTSKIPIDVQPGVTLVGAKGKRFSVTLQASMSSRDSAITLGDGAQLGNLDVVGAPNVGVAIRSPNAKVFDVNVTGAKTAALAVSCSGDACASGTVSLENVTLEKSGLGLWVSGGHVVMSGGRVAENGGTSVSAGLGIALLEGANVQIEGVKVEKNAGTGVLVDGAKTRAVIKGSTVAENANRGIWAQRLEGTLDAPALKVEDSTISKNRIIGMGGLEARGIIIVGGTVVETVAAPVPTNLATTEQIGDGIGLFGGTTDVKIERTNFASNERAAGVVDGTEVGIIIVGGSGRVDAGPSGLKFVVQNSKADIQIAETDKSAPPKSLGISAPKLSIPAVL